jgi:hypothetical protein
MVIKSLLRRCKPFGDHSPCCGSSGEREEARGPLDGWVIEPAPFRTREKAGLMEGKSVWVASGRQPNGRGIADVWMIAGIFN